MSGSGNGGVQIDLSGRTALVTGGSRGIGAACCRFLARAGCDVAVSYRRRADAAARVVREIEGLGRRAIALPADVADPQLVDAMVQGAVQSPERDGRLPSTCSGGRFM